MKPQRAQNPETINKYLLCISEFNKIIEIKNGSTTRADFYKIIENNKVSSSVFNFSIKLGYFQRTLTGSLKSNYTNFQPIHAANLIREINNYNRGIRHKREDKEKEEQGDLSVMPIPPLPSFTKPKVARKKQKTISFLWGMFSIKY